MPQQNPGDVAMSVKVLFIRGLFNDAVATPDHLETNARTNTELEKMQGSSCNLICGTIPKFSLMVCRKLQKKRHVS
jgi:hypothetical protein